MEPRPDPSLDRIRHILRERGYLDRPLDRLFLGRAGSRFTPLRGALKAGLLSGAFLSACLLAALRATGNPPLEGPREFLLLGLYLLMVASVALTGFELVSSAVVLLAAWMHPAAARRAGQIAWGMGGVGAALFAGYLSLWWRGRGMTGWSFSAHLAAAAVILALSLGFGRLTSLATLASWIRRDRFPAPRSRRRLRIVGPLLLAAAAIILIAPWPGSPAARAAPPGRVDLQPRAGRILWIGIDGLGEDLYQSLRREGRFASFAALAGEGCRWTFERAPAPPPAVWVSAATGFAAPRHGVTGIESPRLPGIATPVGESPWTDPLVKTAKLLSPWIPAVEEVPVSGLHRRDKMIWEILGEQGIPSFVVNWWATWPAEEGPGFRLTERAFFRLEAGGEADREVFPPEEYPRLRSDFPRFLAAEAASPPAADVPDSARQGRLLDDYHLAVARGGWTRTRYPFFAVYLNGPDVIGSESGTEEGQAARIARSRLLLDHLERLDRAVGEWARSLAPEDILILQADPGRTGAHSPGFVLLRGGGIRRGVEGAGRLLDLVPTLLRLAGFPESTEMEGHPRAECFDPDGPLAAPAPPAIASYGERRPPGAGSNDFDPEVLEKLRSLGYLR